MRNRLMHDGLSFTKQQGSAQRRAIRMGGRSRVSPRGRSAVTGGSARAERAARARRQPRESLPRVGSGLSGSGGGGGVASIADADWRRVGVRRRGLARRSWRLQQTDSREHDVHLERVRPWKTSPRASRRDPPRNRSARYVLWTRYACQEMSITATAPQNNSCRSPHSWSVSDVAPRGTISIGNGNGTTRRPAASRRDRWQPNLSPGTEGLVWMWRRPHFVAGPPRTTRRGGIEHLEDASRGEIPRCVLA